MLVLTRRVGQEIVIDNDIRIVVISIRGASVRLGFAAPPDVAVDRAEIRALRDLETVVETELCAAEAK